MEIDSISANPISTSQTSGQASAAPTSSLSFHSPREVHRSSLQSLSVHQEQPSVCSCLKRLFDLLCFPFLWLYKKLFPSSTVFDISTARTHSKFPECIVDEVIDPLVYPHRINHPHKIAAYDALVEGRDIRGPVHFYKYALDDRSYLSHCPIFQMSGNPSRIDAVNGAIPYDQDSTPECAHWVANFADSAIMGFCEGPLLAQDEVQVVAHPTLYHVKTALVEKGHARMKENEIYLLRNVPCVGCLDTQSPLANGQTLYGNQFAQSTREEVLSKLFHYAPPILNNIFFIAAPRIGNQLTGKPYQKNHLELLFYTAYTAFFAVNRQSLPSKSCLIHTGNWGAGAFGNSAKVSHLIQIAAARAAGVDLQFHPLDQMEAFHAANALFNEIERQHPGMSVDQFIDHLTEHAQEYGLLYGRGNGT